MEEPLGAGRLEAREPQPPAGEGSKGLAWTQRQPGGKSVSRPSGNRGLGILPASATFLQQGHPSPHRPAVTGRLQRGCAGTQRLTHTISRISATTLDGRANQCPYLRDSAGSRVSNGP